MQKKISKIKKDIEKSLENQTVTLYSDNVFQIDNNKLFLRYNNEIPFLISEKTFDEINKHE